MDLTAKRRQLEQDGFCVVEGVLDPAMQDRVRALSAAALAQIGPAHREKYRSEGSLVPLADHPDFADLIVHPPALEALRGLGFADVRFSSGYVISKPPQGPALFWHQDWWGWGHPLSYTGRIPQIALFYYLTRTERANGCLRVIPGSHRRRHPLHDATDAHDESLAKVAAPEDRVYQPAPGEVAVEVVPGDLVIADARLLHGAYPNTTDAERTLLTLWYHPDYGELPASMRTRIHEVYRRVGVDTDPGAGDRLYPERWPAPQRAKVAPLLPDAGDAPAEPWVRTPVDLR